MAERYTTELYRVSGGVETVAVKRRSDGKAIGFSFSELQAELSRRQKFALAKKTPEGVRRVMRAKAIELAKAARVWEWA